MKYGLILFFALLSVSGKSQGDSSLWSLSVQYNGGWSYRKLSAGTPDLEPLKSILDKTESGRIVHGVQIGIQRKLRDNFVVSSGIGYQQMGYTMDSIEGMSSISQTLGYVQIPLFLKYVWNETARVSPFISLGVTYGYLAVDRLRYKEIDGNRTFEVKDAGQWNSGLLSLGASSGVHFHVFPQNRVSIGIQGQYAVNSATTTQMNRHLYGFGLQLGWIRLL